MTYGTTPIFAKTKSAGTTASKEDKKKFANLIGPTDPKLDREVRELLITARVGLLLRASFFGNLATRLTLVNADEWCSTAATDGRRFYYNSRFIKMLRPKEVEFLFGHEVLHCVYDHMGRRGERDPQLWNIADDYCVNADLIKHRVGEKITTVPCLYDKKYDGMCAEEVYDLLYENAEKIDISDLLDKMLDEHMDEDGEGDGDGNEEGQGKRPKLSKEERQAIKDEIKEAVLAAAAATEDAGNIPAGVRRLISDLTAPKMNWRELLRMNLESTIKSDYTWMRASRKGWHMDAVMPGQKPDEMIDIAVAIDTSGSICGEMLKDFLGEIQGIMDQYTCYKIHVMSWDTQVHNPQQYDSDNLDSITDYEIAGFGGTDPVCVFDYLKENGIEPKRLVVFTDGYFFGGAGDENYCDTLWIVHSNPSFNTPFGVSVEYEAETESAY
jgi:predicted metal-dependent peptidase